MVPARIRTMLYRYPSAVTVMVTISPARVTSHRVIVRTVSPRARDARPRRAERQAVVRADKAGRGPLHGRRIKRRGNAVGIRGNQTGRQLPRCGCGRYRFWRGPRSGVETFRHFGRLPHPDIRRQVGVEGQRQPPQRPHAQYSGSSARNAAHGRRRRCREHPLTSGRQPSTACIASCKVSQTVGALGCTWKPAYRVP